MRVHYHAVIAAIRAKGLFATVTLDGILAHALEVETHDWTIVEVMMTFPIGERDNLVDVLPVREWLGNVAPQAVPVAQAYAYQG